MTVNVRSLIHISVNIRSLIYISVDVSSLIYFRVDVIVINLLDFQAKHMIMLRDSVVQEIIQFLEHCESK